MACFVLVLAAIIGLTKPNSYVIPVPKITAYEPNGVRVSLPDAEGVSAFFFWANVNYELERSDLGEIQLDTFEPTNGEWLIQDDQISLAKGDVIYYITFVEKNGIMHRLDRMSYVVTEVIPRPPEIVTTTSKSAASSTILTSVITTPKSTTSFTSTTTRSTHIPTTTKTTPKPTPTPSTTITTPRPTTPSTTATTTKPLKICGDTINIDVGDSEIKIAHSDNVEYIDFNRKKSIVNINECGFTVNKVHADTDSEAIEINIS